MIGIFYFFTDPNVLPSFDALFIGQLNKNMDGSHIITIDPEILGGTPVFKGTRVPVNSLFEYLEDHYTLDEFLECFPTVTREMAGAMLECALCAIHSVQIRTHMVDS